MQVVVHGSELSAATAAAALATVGHQVYWWPHPAQPWSALSESDWLKSEPGLLDQLQQNIAEGTLQLCDSPRSLPAADIYWLGLSADQRHDADQWVESTLSKESHDFVLVNNSTFPIGHTEKLEELVRRDRQVAVALPDMLEEGRALGMFMRPERWMLGSENEWAERQIRELLRAFNRREDVFQLMPRRAAELTKLAIIGMLATRVSYMNELADMADHLEVDIETIRQGMGADRRIGHEYLYPGSGFGGPSFARNLHRLSRIGEQSNRDSALLKQVIDVNAQKQETLFRRFWQYHDGQIDNLTVAIWGAAFKPNTARIDQAPVLRLIEALWAQNVHVRVHDPAALPSLSRYYGEHPLLTLVDDNYQACEGADALMLVTEWKCYWNPDWRRLATLLNSPLILDGRNIYDPGFVAGHGLVYRGVGRKADPVSESE
ncbi:nucleotide sugar dehydrogenase [Kushneria phosphatilytica]|uniref:UDP-glucose 6-dehydrogenase n=1 Tax=Kushneria phosphatilytica TaxID=657387 RepID=A0A1S1NRS2_9GAMM|nr:nucleotide sugar dehydrogenase [Kushneria phosphatilytica]OHV11939.1 UDP-glucose 6-dehydrogenase [Kushneria phosphatilytica]QEL11121.1 UDP-glucose/GDP-mannose dehydrogenase family protein [Kushneria phosphatilytica]